MIRPSNAKAYEPIDLKLGIKSSLPRVKATLALLILMWKLTGEPDSLVYAEENGNSLILKPNIEQTLLTKLISLGVNFSTEQLHSLLQSNCLLSSQLEALIVAFELIGRSLRYDLLEICQIVLKEPVRKDIQRNYLFLVTWIL